MDARIILALKAVVILLTGNIAEGQTCIYTISTTNGILDYPTNSGNYSNNLNCTWIFIAPVAFVVEITFTTIDLEPPFLDLFCKDTITVYDGFAGPNPVTSPFCGNGPSWPRTPNRFLSTSNILSIIFQTDGSLTGTGFVADYKQVLPRRESIAAINVDMPSIIQFNRFAAQLFDTIPLLQSTRPSALDFDPIAEFFYYTDIDDGFIGRIKNDGSTDEILVEENVQEPMGVAVAYLTGLLYWTDIGEQEVSVSRLDGSFRKTLVFPNTGCSSPRAIILSTDHQDVFWTCDGKIMKAKADGSESQTLVGGLNDPRTIALDEDMFLYWVDVGTASVGKIGTNGALQEQLFQHDVFSGVHSFVLDSFSYYWSRPADKDIIDVDRHDPMFIGTLSLRDPVTMEGLYYYKSDRPIAEQHICATGTSGCQKLCFPEGQTFTCEDASATIATPVTTKGTTTISKTAAPSVCIHTLPNANGELDYPVTSGNYTNNLNCTWNFVASTGRVVEVMFTAIDLQPPNSEGVCKDAVTVYDGTAGSNPFTLPFCGDGPSWPRRPHRFLSSSNTLSITLETDGSLTGTGFVLEYNHVLPRRESIAAINVEVPSIIQINRFATRLFDTIPLLQSTRPSALDFDPIAEVFYYSDIADGFIGRIKYDASADEILVTENVQSPMGVAVGYLTGLLYWTDVGRQEVSVSRLDGTFRKTLVFPNTGCNSPKDIKLSDDHQNVFWTCDGKIMKARADGSDSQTLVGGLIDPTTIVLDEGMFLYWVDVGTASVGRISTDGTLREDLLLQHIVFSGVHSFVLDSFTYYWSRPVDKDIIDIDRHEPNSIGTLSLRDPVTMEGLYYYKSDKPIAQEHACATGQSGCQELCFPQGLTPTCVIVSPTVLNCSDEIIVTSSQSFQRVFWGEPVAISHTSQRNGQLLMYDKRTSKPGDIFFQGTTTVTYTFKDELSNIATCSFNVVVLPGTTTISTTTTSTGTTTISTTTTSTATNRKSTTADTSSSAKSPEFTLDLLLTEYLVYTVLGIVIVVLCIIILIAICTCCCCSDGCRCCARSRRSQTRQSSDNMGYDNKGAFSMGPVGGHVTQGQINPAYPNYPGYPTHPSYPSNNSAI